jgi:PEP-CTERM motif
MRNKTRNMVRQAMGKTGAGLVLMGAAMGAFAAQATLEFKTFYDTSTPYNTKDLKTWNSAVATLKLVDNPGGGLTGTLTFLDTDLPAGKAGLSIDELWLSGSIKGTVSAQSGAPLSANYYKKGFLQEGRRFNYDINYKANTFKEGQTSKFTITGATVASIVTGLTLDPTTSKGFMLEVAGVGKPYSGFLGLNSVLHFVPSVLPEPSTYALMGLGLLGIAFVARAAKAQDAAKQG